MDALFSFFLFFPVFEYLSMTSRHRPADKFFPWFFFSLINAPIRASAFRNIRDRTSHDMNARCNVPTNATTTVPFLVSLPVPVRPEIIWVRNIGDLSAFKVVPCCELRPTFNFPGSRVCICT